MTYTNKICKRWMVILFLLLSTCRLSQAQESFSVPMRDGIKIAVDIYRPVIEGRYPALLSMSPYMKELQLWPPELSHSIEAGDTRFFVPKGYVHIIASSRGSGLSQGEYNWYDAKEQQDSPAADEPSDKETL